MDRTLLGLLLGVLSGVMTGSFSLPMKKTIRWSWEATWLVWSLAALLVIPWTLAFLTTPHLFEVLSNASAADMSRVFLFGLCWGLGAVFFGQSIAMIGISLAFALCIGLATALGALIPMLGSPEVFSESRGIWASVGIVIMMAGVAVCAMAGHQKDKQLQRAVSAAEKSTQSQSGTHMLLGLVLAILGGIFSSMLNLAFNYSQSIKQAAFDAGASSGSAADAVWALTLTGGLVTNIVYCSFLLFKNKTWSDYRKPNTGTHWLLAVLMALIWMPSIAIYGRAAELMGDLGGSAGWGLYMGLVIVVSNGWGFVTGEWRGIRGRPVALIAGGIVMLLIAIIFIGYSTTV